MTRSTTEDCFERHFLPNPPFQAPMKKKDQFLPSKRKASFVKELRWHWLNDTGYVSRWWFQTNCLCSPLYLAPKKTRKDPFPLSTGTLSSSSYLQAKKHPKFQRNGNDLHTEPRRLLGSGRNTETHCGETVGDLLNQKRDGFFVLESTFSEWRMAERYKMKNKSVDI